MSFDLNNKEEFGTNSIFNNGVAGEVKNVEIDVAKKTNEDHAQAPDYKLLIKDANGEVNQGFYIMPNGHANMSADEIMSKQKVVIGRILSVARAVMGNEYEFPKVTSAKEAIETLLKIIKENAKGKKFNVFINYGTKGYPRQFMTVRFFDFIQPADSKIKLMPKPDDLLETLMPDTSTDDLLSGNDTEEDLDGWI